MAWRGSGVRIPLAPVSYTHLFRKWVGDLISLVNEYCSIDGPEAEVFRTIVHLERRFFDDSYPQE